MSKRLECDDPILLEEPPSAGVLPPDSSSYTSDDSSSSGDSIDSDVAVRKPPARKWKGIRFVFFATFFLAVILLVILLKKSDRRINQESSASSSVTPFPSISPATKGPTKPTFYPTRPPVEPTQTPSLRPTRSPSKKPTLPPTFNPTLHFSATPSSYPTPSPTGTPTGSPTETPTAYPTITPTESPTRSLLPDSYNFRLKMHWERQYFWQEEDVERQWCLECTRCSEVTGSGNPLDVCRDPNNNDGTDCELNDQLWIQNCNGWNGSSGNARFEIVRHRHGDQIKILNKDLCVERVGNRFLNLQRCDEDEEKQLFVGFDPSRESFDIRPVVGGSDGKSRCWSQHHWPKKYEMLFLEECDLAYTWDTALWEAI